MGGGGGGGGGGVKYTVTSLLHSTTLHGNDGRFYVYGNITWFLVFL